MIQEKQAKEIIAGDTGKLMLLPHQARIKINFKRQVTAYEMWLSKKYINSKGEEKYVLQEQ